jgi:hypothetical protein
MSVSMGRVAVEIVKAPEQGMGRLRLGRAVATHRFDTQLVGPALHTPLANRGRGVTCFL